MYLHTYANPLWGKSMFLIAHCGIPFAIYEMYQYGFNLRLITCILVGWIYDCLGGLGITAGAHRLWSHRSYKADTFFRSILMIFNCIAYQGELWFWVRDHRVHHKYSDTSADPHDSTRGFWYSHMGWLLLPRTDENEKANKEIPMVDMDRDPVVQFQNSYYALLVFIFRLMVPLLTGWFITGSWRIGLFFNVCMMWCQSLHHTFLVNSAAHLPSWGYRPYSTEIPPTEVKLVIFAAMGEGHHNFHHVFPHDYATSELGWKGTFNPSKWFIDWGASKGWVTERTRVVKRGKDKNGKDQWQTTKIKGFSEDDA